MTTKTIAAATMAALALPAGAQAAKPERPAKAGKTAKSAKKSAKAQKVGFSLAGTQLTGLSFTDAGSSAFSLDLTKANKHALAALGLKKAQLAEAFATELPAESNGFTVKFDESVVDGDDADTTVGLTDVLATDRVKVIGKVTRTRNARTAKGKRTYTYSTIDIRKVVVSRGEDA